VVRAEQGDEVVEGIARGIDPQGALRLEVAGEIRLVRSGEVLKVRAVAG